MEKETGAKQFLDAELFFDTKDEINGRFDCGRNSFLFIHSNFNDIFVLVKI